MIRIGFISTISLTIGLIVPRAAKAQCSDPCRPYALGKIANNTTVRYAAGSGMSPYFQTFLTAASNWDVSLSTAGSSVSLAEGSGDWTVILDDTLPSYIAGETSWQYRTVRINAARTADLFAIAIHEIGHTLLLADVDSPGCASQTSIFATLSGNPGYVTSADDCTIDHVYRTGDESPIILTLQAGYPVLTGAEVWFDLANSGTPHLVGWTEPGTRAGFLVLDRDGDGRITSGAEMFGNYTPFPGTLPEYVAVNGFQALAAYDAPLYGGNDDGWITSDDRVFSMLKVWIDENHNGSSEAIELNALSKLGVEAIHLQAREARKRDRFGNELRYTATFILRTSPDKAEKRVAVDVYFVHR